MEVLQSKKFPKIYAYIFLAALLLLRAAFWCNSFAADCENIVDLSHNSICKMRVKAVGIPKVKDDSTTFYAKVISAEKTISSKILVRVKYSENLSVDFGDVLDIRGEFVYIPDAMNAGNFDYREYLITQGVSGIFETDISKISRKSESIFKGFYQIRNRVSDKIINYLPKSDAGFVNALVTGDKDELPEDISESFKRAGVYHIVAVSGLHLNIFILFLSYLVTKIPCRRRKKLFFAIVINASAIIFVLMFTGYGISIKRAAVMSAISVVSILFYRQYSPMHALILAVFVILFLEPYAIGDISFKLSFLGTAGIISGVNFIKSRNLNEKPFAVMREGLTLSIFSWLFTFVPTASSFYGVSLITPISNMAILIFIAPLMAFSYIFAFICIFMPQGFCEFLGHITVIPSRAVILLSELFSSIPGAYVPVSEGCRLFIIAEGIVIFFIAKSVCKNRKRTFCILASLLIIANSYFLLYNSLSKKFVIDFINVGQGDCAILKTPLGRNVLIDCGSESEENVYDDVVKPYMNYENIFKIDHAIVTHYHSDHTNGIVPMINDGRIRNLVLPDKVLSDDEKTAAHEIIKAAISKKIPIDFVSKGDIIHLDSNSMINVLNPDSSVRTEANESSLVFKINCFGKNILFTGDIGNKSQLALLDEGIKADIVKIPHHGGFSVISDDFARITDCDFAVISCDFGNSYGHPHKSTLKSYKNSKILRTDKDYTIKFKIYKNHMKHYVYK